jgi:hypothetical protein
MFLSESRIREIITKTLGRKTTFKEKITAWTIVTVIGGTILHAAYLGHLVAAGLMSIGYFVIYVRFMIVKDELKKNLKD